MLLCKMHIAICFACWFSIFQRGHTAFEVEKQFKTCVFSIVSAPKATLKIFKVCVHLNQFKVKLDVDKP